MLSPLNFAKYLFQSNEAKQYTKSTKNKTLEGGDGSRIFSLKVMRSSLENLKARSVQ